MTTAQTLERDQQDQADTDAEGSTNRLGRALDVAGIVAGVVLGVILFDIVSGGKLTRWARARRAPKPDSGCEGCGDGEGGAEE